MIIMYKKINLPYTSLEPYISDETLHFHYGKHYSSYLDHLNKMVGDLNYSKEEIVFHIEDFPSVIRDDLLYQVGGVLNHELYFLNMGFQKTPFKGELKEKILNTYGSEEAFIEAFKEKSQKLVGSGYTFLVIKQDGNLDIINLSNQDTPYSYGMIPIMALDLWEHAYYLDYKNDRNLYIHNFFQIVDFDYISNLYDEKKQQYL